MLSLSMKLFHDFRPDTRLWVYAFPRRLDPAELQIVRGALTEFVDDWKSHQDDVRGAFGIVHDQFVFLAGETADGVSGCSIDSSVRVFKALKTQFQLDALNRSLVYFRDGDYIKCVSRPDFQRLVDEGKIKNDTVVFNNAITKVGELQTGFWEIPFAQSWHAVAFVH